MRSRQAALVLAALVVGASGCGSDSPEQPDVRVRGSVIDFSTRAPILGFEVCVVGAEDSCLQTDDDGAFELSVGQRGQHAIRLSHDEYLDLLIMFDGRAGDHEFPPFEPARLAMLPLLAAAAGEEIDLELGLVSATVVTTERVTAESRDETLEAVVIDASPTEGGRAIYTTEAQLPAPELEATTAAGLALFVNVPPGRYDYAASHPTRSCRPTVDSWPGTGSATAALVQAGAMSDVRLVCD